MRRTIICLATSATTVLAALVVSTPAASAADPITGRLVDRTTQGTATLKAVPGATLRLRAINGDGTAGAIVEEATTGGDGSFSLPVPDGPGEYYIRVLPTTSYQGGWVGRDLSTSSNNVLPSIEPVTANADFEYVAGEALDEVSTMPAYFSGRVINSKTLRPVANARITGRDANEGMTVEGSDVSGPKGYFRVNGLTCEDSCYLKVNGSAIGYETGFLTGHRVVPTFGQAVAITPGPVGNVKLDRL